jgi:hypothetical protein
MVFNFMSSKYDLFHADFMLTNVHFSYDGSASDMPSLPAL